MTLQEEINLGFAPKFPYKMIDAKQEVELSMGIENRVLYIAFLGSVSKMDWVHNFMFWKKPYKQMKDVFFVHAGFLKIYQIVRDDINEYIQHHLSDFDTVYISGHSLGGAIATLCNEDLSFLREQSPLLWQHKVTKCVTTGAPRVFATLFNRVPKGRCDTMLRVVCRSDGVPSLPFAFMGYKHVGQKFHAGKKRKLGILHPSFVYNHDVRDYQNIADFSYVDNANTNTLFTAAWKVYKIIYLVLALLILLAVGVCL